MADREVIQRGNLWLLAFDASELGVVAIENDPARVNVVAPVRVRAAMDNFPDLIGVVDGSQFGIASHEGNYATSQHDVVFYRHRDLSAGIDIPAYGAHAREGSSISVKDGKAYAHRHDEFEPGATVGIQSYPNVMMAGVVDVFRLGYSTYMSGVGILRDGRTFIALGRYDIPEFGLACKDVGAIYLGYGDGGGSGGRALRLDDGTIEYRGSMEQRRVATLYACVNRGLFTSPDGRGGIGKPAQSASPSKILALGLAGGVAATAAVFLATEYGPQVRRWLSR